MVHRESFPSKIPSSSLTARQPPKLVQDWRISSNLRRPVLTVQKAILSHLSSSPNASISEYPGYSGFQICGANGARPSAVICKVMPCCLDVFQWRPGPRLVPTAAVAAFWLGHVQNTLRAWFFPYAVLLNSSFLGALRDFSAHALSTSNTHLWIRIVGPKIQKIESKLNQLYIYYIKIKRNYSKIWRSTINQV